MFVVLAFHSRLRFIVVVYFPPETPKPAKIAQILHQEDSAFSATPRFYLVFTHAASPQPNGHLLPKPNGLKRRDYSRSRFTVVVYDPI